MKMKLFCLVMVLACGANAIAMPLNPGPWVATSDKGVASVSINSDGVIQKISINGIDTGNPHFGLINASYVLGRGYDWLQWTTPTEFVAGYYGMVYTPPNNPTSVKVGTFRVVGRAISANRIEATWSIFGYESFVDASGKWQYQQYAMQGGEISAVLDVTNGKVTPVDGDFDGDGLNDLAVYRQLDGQWSILQSSNGQIFTLQFGGRIAIPVPGDYDNDGKTDIAVFYPRGGNWYIRKSSDGLLLTGGPIQFGFLGTIPKPGDYNGDGRDDICVYLPRSNTWYIKTDPLGGLMTGGPITFALPSYP